MVRGILHKQPASLKLVIFTGLYLVGMVLYYTLVLGAIMPAWFHLTLQDIRQSGMADPEALHALKIAQLLYSVISFLLPAFVYSYLTEERPLRDIGLYKKPSASAASLAVLILLASLPLVGVLADWNQHIRFPAGLDASIRELQKQAEAMTRAFLRMPGIVSLVFNLFMIALIPAIAEEWFFRAALQRLLIRATGAAWAGIGLSAVVFSLLHGEMLGFFPRIALGVLLGLIYFLSGNLWLSVLAHFFNNGMQVLLVYLFQHHHIAYDVSKDQAVPWFSGLISLGFVVALFYLFRKFTAKDNAIS